MCTATDTKLMTRAEEQEMLANMSEKERDTYLKVDKLMGLLLTNICGYSEEDMNKFYADKPTENKETPVTVEETSKIETEVEGVVKEETLVVNNVQRVSEMITPIKYDNNSKNKTIVPYIDDKGNLGMGEIVESTPEEDEMDTHVYDDVDYADQADIQKVDNSALLDKYPTLKPVEVAIRQIDGYDVLFKEEKKLIQASVIIDNLPINSRSFTIDVNGCILSGDLKWFPVLYPAKETAGYESYPALEMDMGLISSFVKGEFEKDPSLVKGYSMFTEEELEVNKLFDLASLKTSDRTRKSIVKTLSKYTMNPETLDQLYGFHKRPRFRFNKVKSEKEFSAISHTGIEYNYGMGNKVIEQFPMEVMFKDGNFQVLTVPEALK